MLTAKILANAIAATAIALVAASPSRADGQASLPDIEDEVMCPICGTTLELSEAPQAERERELIRRLIDQGRSKEEIKDALVAEYGPEVLAVPEGSGFDLSAWLVPIAALLIVGGAGGVATARLIRRSRSSAGEEAQDLDPDEAARVERDLSSYDP